MTDTIGFPEDDWTIRRGRSERDILPPVNPYPATYRLRIENVHRHRETGIPDALLGAPELDRARGSATIKDGIQPALMCRIVHGQRDTLFDAPPQSKRDRIRLADFVQRPILIVGLQWQAPKLFDLRAGIGMANRLIDLGSANLDMRKCLARQCTPLAFWHRQHGVCHRRV